MFICTDWADYDLISNSFAEEALRLMVSAARRANDSHTAQSFASFRQKLQRGINTSLSHVVGDGGADMERTPIYAELRPKGPGSISPSDEFVWVRHRFSYAVCLCNLSVNLPLAL